MARKAIIPFVYKNVRIDKGNKIIGKTNHNHRIG